MNEEITFVFKTDEYDKFSDLLGNRDVKNNRKAMLMESINEIGYITNPIIVNEKYEVIDGQGRLAACKELGIPVTYIIVDGIGIRECMRLNQNMKNWTARDYVESYAEQGNQSYKYLLKLLTDHGEGMAVTAYAALGIQGGGWTAKKIYSGEIVITAGQFFEARQALQFLQSLKPYIEKIDGNKSSFKQAVIYAYKCKQCNSRRLADVISKNYKSIGPVANFRGCLEEISELYNKNLRSGKDRIYLQTWYDQERHE